MLLAVQILAMLLPSWPFARAATSPGFWRTFPRMAMLLASALAGYVAAVCIAASLLPAEIAAVLALVALGVAAWLGHRARPFHGRTRGWPPGSLALLPLASWTDPRFFQRLAATHGSVFKCSHFARPMVCILGLERGHRLLREHDRSLHSPPLPFGRYIPAGFLRHMAHEDHRIYRALFVKVFQPEVHRRQAGAIREAIADGLAAIARAAGDRDALGVRTKPFLNRIVFRAWTRLFFGIEADTAEFDRLKRCYHVLDMRNPLWASNRTRWRAIREACAIVSARAEQSPSDCYLAEMIRVDPRMLDDPNALRNLIFVLHTSWSDVAALLQWVWKMLADHPDHLAMLRAPDDTAPPLATRIVMETLRLEQSEHLYRVAVEPISFDGFVIPAGWLVRVLVRESHRMPESFRDPETFDPDRFCGAAPSKREYAPFGALRHACLGDKLTLDVATMFVEELSRFEWRVTDDGPREFSRWRHWAPSGRFRVAMQAVAG